MASARRFPSRRKSRQGVVERQAGPVAALLFGGALLIALACSAFRAAEPVAAEPPDEARVEIVVLHTNDLHGQAYPQKAIWRDKENPPEVGGLSAVASFLGKEREEASKRGAATLLLDAGDIWQGTPEGNLTDGRLVVEWMNALGYQAAALGNHEFDHGQEPLRKLLEASRFPWLAANCRLPGEAPKLGGETIIEAGGLKVGIVGLVTSDLKTVSSPRVVEGVTVEKEEEALRRILPQLRPKVDVLLLLTHCGVDADKRLAAAFPEVDAIVGGHSHTGLEKGYRDPKTGVLVVQTFGKGSAVGRLTLVYDRAAKKVVEKKAELVSILTADWPAHAPTEAILGKYKGEIDAVMAVELGECEHDLLRAPRGVAGTSPLGNWLTDVMREAAKAEIAFHNKTGVRADIPRGKITKREVFQVSPFGNTLVTMELTGAQVLEELEWSLGSSVASLEMSGIEGTCDPKAPVGSRVREVKVGGEPLDKARRYKVVTNSFLAKGGDGHATFTKGENVEDTGIDLMEAHAADVKARTPVKLEKENRLRPIDKE